ncbi:MAG: hypothetical protein LBT53_00605 [Puniceicoccales bacterium]|jgi:hypothetical protein|nr:hypothetical protein [Puniceicoccales bacterium]
MAKKINPIVFAFVIPVLGGVAIAIVLLVTSFSGSSGTPLDVAAYRDNWTVTNTGKNYRLYCVVENFQLRKSDNGVLLVVRELKTGQGDAGAKMVVFLPNAVAETLNSPVANDQRFHFVLRPHKEISDLLEVLKARKD